MIVCAHYSKRSCQTPRQVVIYMLVRRCLRSLTWMAYLCKDGRLTKHAKALKTSLSAADMVSGHMYIDGLHKISSVD